MMLGQVTGKSTLGLDIEMSETTQRVTAGKVAHAFLRTEALYAPEVRRQFKRRRIVVVPQGVSTEGCDAVLRSLSSTKFIVVEEPQTRFYTKNGDALIEICPEITEVESGLLEWINDISETTWLPRDNRAIGISLNVTPPGGKFVTHHDRHAITVILYLNDADGGALNVYPAFPMAFGRELHGPIGSPWVRYSRRIAIRRLKASRNPLAKAAHRVLFRPVRISPRAGTVVAFTGLSDHGVDPVAPGSLRFALVVAGDRPGVSFKEGQKYYGYGQEEITLKDLYPADQNVAA